MILSIKINNCFAFNKEINFSMKADMHTKKFISNIFEMESNFNILKSAVIYGPNNTGKTNFIKIVSCIKNTIGNKFYNDLQSNIFNENDNICKIEICFIINDKIYEYAYWFNSETKQYQYERFTEIEFDKYSNKNCKNIFLRDTINNIYDSCDDDLKNVLSMASNDNILIYTIDVTKFKKLSEIKEILVDFGNKIVIVDMNNIKNHLTIFQLKSKSDNSKKTVELIKQADLYLEDYFYRDDEDNIEESERHPLSILSKNIISVYKNKQVSSVEYDSVGTRKFSALASFIVESLENGKILFIDEIDSSLHFKLTRAILSLFNNSINTKAQLICTSHDISLLDCKKMFRKEQIWFTDKDQEETRLYSLKEFNANDDGIRENTDLVDKYAKGFFNAIPEPDLLEAFYEND